MHGEVGVGGGGGVVEGEVGGVGVGVGREGWRIFACLGWLKP